MLGLFWVHLAAVSQLCFTCWPAYDKQLLVQFALPARSK
jgi:hypothetical protein